MEGMFNVCCDVGGSQSGVRKKREKRNKYGILIAESDQPHILCFTRSILGSGLQSRIQSVLVNFK